ncbi:hypothetical protein PanWU01x14_256840 [Parasponia andersonii]|uniref:Uncharacterized protein n=1 Tax=Parasponia andersonii TaxID=3476 RepID=A0A2P5BA79_PARAD|nr:hypothetical protein PanWU01x14_256840 [Parasponia andersonii]
MKDSKSRGMNWAGNIYHKFEGIIPEVNDITIQDTFKYVENHVHTVGGSFKKFCSGVVQDFLPLSADPVKCEAKAVVPEGDAAINTLTRNNSVISIVEVSSDAVVKKSSVVIDAIDHVEKQLGHVLEHHDADQPKNAKSTDTYETSVPVLATRKINILANGDSGLSNDKITIKESADGPAEITFPCVKESFEASSVDEVIETNHSNDCVSEFDPTDHAEKQLDHLSFGHHEADQFKTAESTNAPGTSVPVLGPGLSDGNSDLINEENAIKEFAGGPLNLTTFPGVTESFEASSLDESVETLQENDSVVSLIDGIDHVEKQQQGWGHVSTGHHNADQLRNAKSMYTYEASGSVLASREINILTNANSDLSNYVSSKESADGQLELTSPGVAESSGTLSLDELTETDPENECVFSAKVAPATSVQGLEIKRDAGVFCDSYSDDAECFFGDSGIPSERAFSVVSGEDTIRGTGLVSATGSRLRDSTTSDILFPGAMFCRNPGDLAGCVSDNPRGILSSTPASIMSINDKALEKQLVSSSSILSLEFIDGSNADVADTGMETIDLCDEMKLAESCVFVDDSDLYAVSRRARKLDSYKKKIRDIFASKKRLAKEYEQLAIWYGDTDIDSSQDASFDLQNSTTRHACDSGWELL